MTGIVSHPDKHQSLAIIKTGNQQQILRAGDSIANTKASITSIHSDRIVLNRNGRSEALLLRPDEPDRLRNKPEQLTTKPTRGHESATAVSQIIQLTSVREARDLKGYRISSGHLGDTFQRAGFKSNDIVVAIDGYDMTDPKQASEILRELQRLEQISITVERNGQLHQIQLAI